MRRGSYNANKAIREYEKNSSERERRNILQDKKDDLNRHKAKLGIVADVLWECLSEMGVTKEELALKLKEIEERGWAINPPSYYQLCPKCGKKVHDYTASVFEGTCMYCGHVVRMYPGDIEE